MSRLVVGLDCGETFILNEGASYEGIRHRVTEQLNSNSHTLLHFVSDRGRVSVNAGAINYILEDNEL